MSERHTLTVTLDEDGHAIIGIQCLWDGDPTERPCGSYTDGPWPDENTCRCTNGDCGCREGDHDDCYEYGFYIENIDTACRAEPTGECWFVGSMDAVGSEAFAFHDISFAIPVAITGNSSDEPIHVSPIIEPTQEVPT